MLLLVPSFNCSVPAVVFNHILGLFVMVFMVVISTFDPLWHGHTVATDLWDHQHTNITKELTHKHKDQQTRLLVVWCGHNKINLQTKVLHF